MINKDFIKRKRDKVNIYEYHKLINEYEKDHNFGLAFKLCMECLENNLSEDLRTIICEDLTCDDSIICVCKKCLPYNHSQDIDWKNKLSQTHMLTIDKINKSYITYYKQYRYYHYFEIDYTVSCSDKIKKICCNKCLNGFIQKYSYERFDEDSE
uniref:Uncharacterized protein n=1 Tax=viral metagenome TaxID=1070528 RepID=A0A6C0LL99_9ZZZZ